MAESSHRSPLAGLALSCTDGMLTPLGSRPFAWIRGARALGTPAGLVVLHDLGMALARGPDAVRPPSREQLTRFSRLGGPDWAETVSRWHDFIASVAGTALAARFSRARLDDALLVAVLVHVLAPAVRRWNGPRSVPTLDLGPEDALAALHEAGDTLTAPVAEFDLLWIRHVLAVSQHVRLALELVDLDTVDVLRLAHPAGGLDASAESWVDYLSVLDAPDVSDISNLSLDLLPGVMESRNRGAQQVFAVDGYAGLLTHGSLDSLVLSELAYDDALFEQRLANGELLYYARSAERRPPRVSQQILVDASASMRGRRSVFARALALGIARRAVALGQDASIRFFDTRLHEPLRARAGIPGKSGEPDVVRVLSFRGEHGRNVSRVFAQLAGEMRSSQGRGPDAIWLVTHAECHPPVETVRAVAERCALHGIFMMPSRGRLDLDYLPALASHRTVTDGDLLDGARRLAAARDIVADAGTHMTARPVPPEASR